MANQTYRKHFAPLIEQYKVGGTGGDLTASIYLAEAGSMVFVCKFINTSVESVKLRESKLTRVLYKAVYVATKTYIKCKELSVSEKLVIINNMDAQPLVARTKLAEQLSIPVPMLNNIMANTKNVLQQYVTSQQSRKRVKLINMKRLNQYFWSGLGRNRH